MDRVVFVVRADRTELYEALRAAFARELDVEVLVDRRAVPTRRRRGGSHEPDRRRFDRRLRPQVDGELKQRGWAVVRLPKVGG
ncbi:MAG: hypothetical protein ACREM3_26015 [Candidatus Rokuibacteriota bacterium]